jgi:riboflavin synthase
MFTGIITHTATFKSLRGNTLVVTMAGDVRDFVIGESIALNGVCLTLTRKDGRDLYFDVLEETVAKTNLSFLAPGGKVNCERALRKDDRFGGHFVTGHVDGTGTVESIAKTHGDMTLRVRAGRAITKYLVAKGSVAIDGVSLTLTDVSQETFSVKIIPHTAHQTSLGGLRARDAVNIEVDILAKSVYTFLEQKHGSSIDKTFLARHGFI